MKLQDIINENKKPINEKKEAPESLIRQVSTATDRNDHNGARMLIAASLKLKSFQQAYGGLDAVTKIFRSMPHTAITLRSQLDAELYQYVKKAYDNIDELWSKL